MRLEYILVSQCNTIFYLQSTSLTDGASAPDVSTSSLESTSSISYQNGGQLDELSTLSGRLHV